MKTNREVTVNLKADTSKIRTPQVLQIVSAVKDGKKTKLSEQELVGLLKGKITTRQPEELIFRYYQRVLMDCGFIKIAGYVMRAAVQVAPVAATAVLVCEAGAGI